MYSKGIACIEEKYLMNFCSTSILIGMLCDVKIIIFLFFLIIIDKNRFFCYTNDKEINE